MRGVGFSKATEKTVGRCARRHGVSQKRPTIIAASAVELVVAAAAVAETARDIRRNLLPLASPPEQSATRPSSHRNVDQSAQDHRRTGGRDANRSIFRELRYAPSRKKYRAFQLRSRA